MEVIPPNGSVEEQTFWTVNYETAVAHGLTDVAAKADADAVLKRKRDWIAAEQTLDPESWP